MKHFITALMIAALTTSCSNLRTDKVKDFIPGVYVRTVADEFTKGMDTLVIDVLDRSAGSYSIDKKMSFYQTIDSKELSPQYKAEQWTAIYDDDTHQLMEQRKGKVLSFMPDQHLVSMGGSEYKKVK